MKCIMNEKEEITSIQVTNEIREALNLIKMKKGFKNYSLTIQYLFDKAGLNIKKITEILNLLDDI